MMQVVRGRIIFSSRRLHTRVALVTGVQTCALPIYGPCDARITRNSRLPYWRRRNGRPHPPLRLGCYPAWRSRRMAAIAAFRAQYLPAFQLSDRHLLGAVARSANAELSRTALGRLAGERLVCTTPLLPQKTGLESAGVGGKSDVEGRSVEGRGGQ